MKTGNGCRADEVVYLIAVVLRLTSEREKARFLYNTSGVDIWGMVQQRSVYEPRMSLYI